MSFILFKKYFKVRAFNAINLIKIWRKITSKDNSLNYYIT